MQKHLRIMQLLFIFLGKFAECLDKLEAASRITHRYYEKGEPKNIAQYNYNKSKNSYKDKLQPLLDLLGSQYD